MRNDNLNRPPYTSVRRVICIAPTRSRIGYCCSKQLEKLLSFESYKKRYRVDIMYIAQLLGHSSLKTTQKYLHVEISDLKKMHSLYHPRERKSIK